MSVALVPVVVVGGVGGWESGLLEVDEMGIGTTPAGLVGGVDTGCAEVAVSVVPEPGPVEGPVTPAGDEVDVVVSGTAAKGVLDEEAPDAAKRALLDAGAPPVGLPEPCGFDITVDKPTKVPVCDRLLVVAAEPTDVVDNPLEVVDETEVCGPWPEKPTSNG